jgi:hypothetical protein
MPFGSVHFGREIARERRMKRLPMRLVRGFFLWLSVATIVAVRFVFGMLFAVVKLFD